MTNLCKVLAALLVLAAGAAHAAETYPTKPIRLIVPWAPGGGSEISARIMSIKLGEQLGTTVVIDTRPGAASMLGTQLAARAIPDGYTLLYTDLPVTINPAVNKNVGYDLAKDFVPVSMVATSPAILVMHPSVPVASMAEFIAMAKAQPGKITLGHGGVGATTHVVGELFQLRAGIKLNPVPYKGTGPAVADAVAGQIQTAISTMPAAVPNIQAGRLRGLGIAGKKRSTAIPDVPTMAEAGVKGVEGENWNGVLAPTGVPPAILAVLNREIVKAVNQPQTRERFATFSLEAISSTPEEFRKVIDFELKRWAEVVKAANIQAE
ncbi:MAG: tripartite tricarboxylate transporter substrate binding protein [Betaproteobacteria bacterium]|nr:tripartite tricarboxylate transporter substrate binding protein [Betaproteobacteria bacterium]